MVGRLPSGHATHEQSLQAVSAVPVGIVDADNGITRIEVSFPEPVSIADDSYRAFIELIDEICGDYEASHPDLVMWPAGIGGKPVGNIWADDDLDFDMNVLSIGCTSRERYEGEREGVPQPTRRDVLKALDDYNSLLRSAVSVAEREGAETNWQAFASRLRAVLKEHHRTWRRFSPWLASAQGMSAGTAETEGLSPKDASPVAESDAPNLSPSETNT